MTRKTYTTSPMEWRARIQEVLPPVVVAEHKSASQVVLALRSNLMRTCARDDKRNRQGDFAFDVPHPMSKSVCRLLALCRCK